MGTLDKIRIGLEVLLVIATFASGIYAGSQTNLVEKKDYEVQQLSAKLQQNQNETRSQMERAESLSANLAAAQAELTSAQHEIVQVTKERSELQSSLAALEDKYRRCTATGGTTVSRIPSARKGWETLTFNTGDVLRLSLGGADLELGVVRVTDGGPIVRIEGCPPLLGALRAAAVLRGDAREYLLPVGQTIGMNVSSEYCQSSTMEGGLIHLDVRCDSFDMTQQTVVLSHRKSPLGGNP